MDAIKEIFERIGVSSSRTVFFLSCATNPNIVKYLHSLGCNINREVCTIECLQYCMQAYRLKMCDLRAIPLCKMNIINTDLLLSIHRHIVRCKCSHVVTSLDDYVDHFLFLKSMEESVKSMDNDCSVVSGTLVDRW